MYIPMCAYPGRIFRNWAGEYNPGSTYPQDPCSRWASTLALVAGSTKPAAPPSQDIHRQTARLEEQPEVMGRFRSGSSGRDIV